MARQAFGYAQRCGSSTSTIHPRRRGSGGGLRHRRYSVQEDPKHSQPKRLRESESSWGVLGVLGWSGSVRRGMIGGRSRRPADGNDGEGQLPAQSELFYQITSSRRACAQVRQVMQAQTARHFAQPFSSGREKSAQQSATAEFLQPGPPALRAAAQPLEYAG